MEKKLYKSNDKMVSGVCGGIAEYFRVDKTLVRIIWLVSALFFGFGLLPYIICAVVMPSKPAGMLDDFSVNENYKINPEHNNVLGIGLVFIGVFLLIKQYLPYNFMITWKIAAPLLLVGAGIYLLKKGSGEDDE